MKKIGLALAALVITSPALGKVQALTWDDYYIGGQLSRVALDSESELLSTPKPTVLSVTVGQRVNRYFSVEARAGFGVGTDNIKVYGSSGDELGSAETKIDYMTSIFVKPELPITERLSIYGLAGWSHGEVSVDNESENESDMSYGFGFNVAVNEQTHVYLDWVELMDKNGLEVSSISLGASYRF
jgi:opacity protein-like surface antigen